MFTSSKNEIDNKFDWYCDLSLTYIVVSPYESIDAFQEIRKIISSRPPLHKADQPTKSKWINISSPTLQGQECGYRLLLHITILVGSSSINDYQEKLSKLAMFEHVDAHTRE